MTRNDTPTPTNLGAPRDARQAPHRYSPAGKTARGLGWFSIGLGLAEFLMPGLMARATGLQGHEAVIRAYGVREIITGLGILRAKDPTPWVWGRVGGDLLDMTTLAAGLYPGNPRLAHTGIAMAAVAGVAAADLACAKALSKGPLQEARDYSDRSGLPKPAEQMRGAALANFETPRDYQGPDALRPYSIH